MSDRQKALMERIAGLVAWSAEGLCIHQANGALALPRSLWLM
jgi:hypothetical protein